MASHAQQIAHVPSSVRPPKPLILSPVFRLIPAGLMLLIASAWSQKRTLPYTGLEVQKVPPEKCELPAALEGPLAENNRLFASSVAKIFPGVQGSGGSS